MIRHHHCAIAIAATLLTVCRAAPVHAQEVPAAATLPAVELKAVGGYTGFIDEDMIDHLTLGGAVRWIVRPRFSVEAELLYLRGPGEDRDWTLVPTLSWDFRGGGTVVPYIVGGAGWLHSTLGVGTGLYSFSSWTGNVGGGVRVALARSTFLSLEGRVGGEPFARVTAAIGFRLR